MLKPSESVLTASAMGDVRAPLEGCWISQHTFPTPLVGPDPNDAMAAWRPDFDYSLGLKDPLLGRWRYNDRFSLLHMYTCPHAAIYVSSCCYMLPPRLLNILNLPALLVQKCKN